MADAIENSRPVEWMRSLFEGQNATPESMIRWMLVAWLVLAVALIALDRLSAMLLGRSRPIVQRPPILARTWRWRRNDYLPTAYSVLPSGTMLAPGPDSRPLAVPVGDVLFVDDEVPAFDPLDLLDQPGIPDHLFWESLVSESHPLFGYENNPRLELGHPPERFNPALGRIQHAARDTELGSVSWPSASPDAVVIDLADDEAFHDHSGTASGPLELE